MKKILVLLLSLISLSATAENVNTYGAMTFFSLAYKLSKYETLSFYHYDIYNFEKKEGGGRSFHAGINQEYFQTSYTYQYLPTVGLTLGHIYQRNNPFLDDFQNENRIFEQVTIGHTHRNFTSSHRFRFEERFIEIRENDTTVMRTRLRYQIGAKIPLRGLTIDAGEYYLNTYNEFYFSTTGERNALFSDDWAYFGAGLKTKSWGSFELGPMVQWSRINQDKDTRTHFNIQAGWLVSF